MSTCATCGDVLAGEYCSRCGQRALDLHRPFSSLVSGAVARAMKQPEAFALDYHAFVFLTFSLLFLAARSGLYVMGWAAGALGLGLLGWLLAYLPIALRRVYGGSRLVTGLKLAALGTLYVPAFFAVVPAIFAVALLQF